MDALASLDDKERQKIDEFFAFQRRFHGYLNKRSLAKIENAMMALSIDDRQEKFLAGRIAYGGEFTPETIRTEIEINQEALDAQNYSDLEEFCEWKKDPTSFESHVSHYLQ